MKAIRSQINDSDFNKYLLDYVKERLKQRSFNFICDYFVENDELSVVSYKPNDIINSIVLHGDLIYFSNEKLINHVVYNLGQRFWVNELSLTSDMVNQLYLEYRGNHGKSINELQRRTINASHDR